MATPRKERLFANPGRTHYRSVRIPEVGLVQFTPAQYRSYARHRRAGSSKYNAWAKTVGAPVHRAQSGHADTGATGVGNVGSGGPLHVDPSSLAGGSLGLLADLIGVPNPVAGVDDLLKKDPKAHLSEIVANAGWSFSKKSKEAPQYTEGQVAMAVAMAESGGNPDADNGTCCVGLFQINRTNAGSFGLPSDLSEFDAYAKDPQKNANSGYKIFQSAGCFGCHGGNPWEAFYNGAWKNHIGEDPVITLKSASLVGDVIDGAADAVAAPARAIGDIVEALFNPSTWLRIGKGLLGGILVFIGAAALVFMVANRVNPIRQAQRLANK